MVKAASHHGLDRKYKPWRRGKSQNAKGKKGSLKQQLRGLRRLLPKAQDDQHRDKIQQQITELETEINEKQKVEQQKTNARKSHGVRFLERQRLTRLWHNASKLNDATERQREQYRIGLDMLYVAHYPLEVRYQPLFRKKERIILDGRNLARRAAARGKILRQIESLPRANWIPTQVYDDYPKEWSNEKERETFGVVAPSSDTNPVLNDDRFASVPNSHAAILQAAEAMDAELDAEEGSDEKAVNQKKVGMIRKSASTGKKDIMKEDDEGDSSSDGVVSDSEDYEDADPLQKTSAVGEKRKRPIGEAVEGSRYLEEKGTGKPSSDGDSDSDSGSVDSSSSDSSSEEESDEDEDKDNVKNAKVDANGPSDSAETMLQNDAVQSRHDDDEDDDDDFLLSPEKASHSEDIFAQAKEHVPSIDEARGDKSKGWATQRQRPGQFKKRRTRK